MSLSTIFLIGAGLLLVAFFGRRFLARPKSSRIWLAVYDGRVLRLEQGELVAEGIQSIASKKIYPTSELLAARSQSGTDLYIFGAEHVALANHEALEAARLVMLPRMLFEGGGDMKRFLEYAALVLPLIAVIWVTLKIGDLQTSVNRVDASIQVVQKSVNEPRVVIPKPTEETK